MIRGTTPTFQLKLKDDSIDLTAAENVYATFKQGSKIVTKTGEDIVVNPHRVDVYFSQEETLKFRTGRLEIQLNWTYNDGSRACTKIVSKSVNRNLIERVLQ